jgi:hypothetical protein
MSITAQRNEHEQDVIIKMLDKVMQGGFRQTGPRKMFTLAHGVHKAKRVEAGFNFMYPLYLYGEGNRDRGGCEYSFFALVQRDGSMRWYGAYSTDWPTMCGGHRVYITYTGNTTHQSSWDYVLKNSALEVVQQYNRAQGQPNKYDHLASGIIHVSVSSPFTDDIKRILRCVQEAADIYGRDNPWTSGVMGQGYGYVGHSSASCATAVAKDGVRGYANIQLKANLHDLEEEEEAHADEYYDERPDIRLDEDDYTHDLEEHRRKHERTYDFINRWCRLNGGGSPSQDCLVQAYGIYVETTDVQPAKIKTGTTSVPRSQEWLQRMLPYNGNELYVSSNVGCPSWETHYLMGILRSLKRDIKALGWNILVAPDFGTNAGEGHHLIDSVMLYKEVA